MNKKLNEVASIFNQSPEWTLASDRLDELALFHTQKPIRMEIFQFNETHGAANFYLTETTLATDFAQTNGKRIKFNLDRSALSIKDDIARRLIPQIDDFLNEIYKASADVNKRKQFIKSIADETDFILGGNTITRCDEYEAHLHRYKDGVKFDARISTSSSTIQIHYAPPELAPALAKFFKEYFDGIR